ncbi:hypothetical protein [Arcobacter sp. CECT 8985]|uniref:hypothetical protein n=1 Tax=Arcobacter sp. CECT 8985 TaxID=1935424 RepID=UPI0010286E1B|nr:hypothetical protein [Arcobacter sp. CECT 8985]RXJ88107.1 hypothetical protein CRU93_00490 [Arcobacter sp. CECT 8985]
MESIIALEELIKENESKVALQQKQIKNHEAGVNKLSRMALASAENALEQATELLEKYNRMLEQLKAVDEEELREKEQLAILNERKKYFDAQPSRIKAKREESTDKKLEVLRIIDELPEDVKFQDEELFEIATKSLELDLSDMDELYNKFEDIKSEFDAIKQQASEEEIQELATIDSLIPIVVLHFHVLKTNILEHIKNENKKASEKQEKLLNEKTQRIEKIKKTIEEQQELLAKKQSEDKKNKVEIDEIKTYIKTLNSKLTQTKNIKIPTPVMQKFSGFPKYEDWWIRELWLSHQAYFALYRWKQIINKVCITIEQKKAWSIIFDRWIFIKKLLNDKGKLSYHYHFAFDSLLSTYAELDEEVNKINIESMEKIIKRITEKEDFTKTVHFHDTNTDYLQYKVKKVNKSGKIKEDNVLF